MTAIILAAGFSSRFGRDKLLTEINNRPMIANVVDLVADMNFDETILVFQDEKVRECAHAKDLKCVYNAASAEGISSSIRCGLRNSSGTDAFIFFMGDQPFLDKETVNKLLSAFYHRKGSIIVPEYCGKRGNPVIFSAAWKDALEGLSGDAGGRSIIYSNPEQVYFVDISNQRAGMDIDTPEAYSAVKGAKQ